MSSGAPVLGLPQPALDDAGLRRVLITLCATQVTGWGVLYYAFPVLAGSIGAETGWSAPVLAAAYSAGLVVSALLGITVGHWLDHHGPRWLMTCGSVIGTAAVVLIALAPNLAVFVAGWLVAGVAMSAVLYPPAFAAITRWYGGRRVGALTVLTLAGGLASTIFAPITAALVEWTDWRTTLLVLAGVLAVITVPGHLLGLRLPWPPVPHEPGASQRSDRVAASRPFVALVVAFALSGCSSFVVIVNLVPLLGERGIGVGVAAVALGLGGAGQVVGRLGYPLLHRWFGTMGRTAVVMAGVAVTTALLSIMTGLAGLVVAAMLSGFVRGIMTLLQATAVTERWGTAQYGRLTGLLSAPTTLAGAVAPWLGAALAASLGGYAAMFAVMGGVGVVAVVAALFSMPRTDQHERKRDHAQEVRSA